MLDEFETGIQLVVYFSQNDHIGSSLAVDAILSKALELGFDGGSAFRAVEGFGVLHRLERGHLLSLDDDRGEMVVLVDKEEAKVRDLLEWLKMGLPGRLVTLTNVSLAHLTRKPSPS